MNSHHCCLGSDAYHKSGNTKKANSVKVCQVKNGNPLNSSSFTSPVDTFPPDLYVITMRSICKGFFRFRNKVQNIDISNFLFCLFFSLWLNTYRIYHLSHFSMENSVVLSTFTLSYNPHSSLSPELLSSCKTQTLPIKH